MSWFKRPVVRSLERRLDQLEQAETSDTLKGRVIELERVQRELRTEKDRHQQWLTNIDERIREIANRENQRQEFVRSFLKGHA